MSTRPSNILLCFTVAALFLATAIEGGMGKPASNGVLAVRLRLLEEQFQSEIAQLKNDNAELKVQLAKANERNDWLEGKAKEVVEEENFEKSWLMPSNCSFSATLHTHFTGSLLE